jgi:NADH-ubiquinone oxidoreductase chain 5
MNLILNFILNPWLYFILAIIIGARLYQKGKVVFQEGYLFSITSTIMAMLYWICFLFLLNSLNLDLEFIILVAPFLVYLILSFFKKYLGIEGGKIVILTGQIISLSLILCLLNHLLNPDTTKIIVYNFCSLINIDFFSVDLSFTFDPVTIIAITVIEIISTLVIFYSFEYMKNDERFIQFLANLSFFVGTMIILVSAGNLIVLFIGWEGVGLCSYLLINHYFNRLKANKAALKAMVMNRFGDCFLILAFSLAWSLFGTFDLFTIFTLVPGVTNQTFNFFFFEVHALTTIGFFLFGAAVGKSAQLGLHTWLPDAMEGPTPVSALLHAATMVTAGVLLLIRFAPLLEFTNEVLHSFILVIGSLTAFFAASTAFFQWDIKRIIAFSTCSQLGLMIVAIGLSNYQLALFHFSNHAFFKALLFLSAGVIIHGLNHEQDIRRMGNLRNIFPLCYTTFVIGSLSLAGFPFMSGFYSKDAIFENLFIAHLPFSWLAYFYGVLGSGFTAAYSVRLIYLVFFSTTRTPRHALIKAQENASIIYFSIPLIVLSIFAIFIGYISKDLFIGLGSSFFGSSILNLHTQNIEAEFLNPFYKLIPILYSLLCAAVTLYFFMYIRIPYLKQTAMHLINGSYHKVFFTNSISKFMNKKWYFDLLYVEFIIIPTLQFSENVSKNTFDKGYLSILGPIGFSKFLDFISEEVSSPNSGMLGILMLILISGLNLLVFFSLFMFF